MHCFPKYEHFVADEYYAHIARTLRFPASTVEEGIEFLVQAIISLGKELNINMSIVRQGVKQEEFENVVDVLSERAFKDQCTPANLKLSLISELKEVYK